MSRISQRFIFDLDDTLYIERDYVESALRFAGNLIENFYLVADASQRLIALHRRGAQDPIGDLWDTEALPPRAKLEIVAAMRAHSPKICLRPGAKAILDILRSSGMGFAILTDGRSVTQRSKMAALGCLDANFASISEEVQILKTDVMRFKQIEDQLPAQSYYYVGDNPAKDFVAPNELGWTTVMLADRGSNIHSQDVVVSAEYAAKIVIDDLEELIGMII